MQERIAIIGGIRTPFCKAGGALKNVVADDLAAKIVKELIIRTGIDVNKIDEVIIGNVAQPANATNIARVIALKAGLPKSIPAYTVQRNCASGMEAITSATNKILAGEAEIIIAGGTESMSNIPLFFGKKMTNLFTNLFKARNLNQKLSIILSFRPSFLKPVIGVVQGLTDPVADMIMGCTAEVLSKKFEITRQDQDKFAVISHNRAEKAEAEGIFKEEILPIYNHDPKKGKMITKDEGIREGQNIATLAKLKPYFEKGTGTVTVGNSSQLTDGAAAVIIMKESKVKELGLESQILGYLKEYAYVGLEPTQMGLGPVYATSKVFDKANISLKDIDLIELNEAFASQVIACQRAFACTKFAKDNLGKDQPLGIIDHEKLNVNGGAIALGHPVGTTGIRIAIHLLKELKRRGKKRGLATLCIGGGQGGALILETE